MGFTDYQGDLKMRARLTVAFFLVAVMVLISSMPVWAGMEKNQKYDVGWYVYLPDGNHVVLEGKMHIINIETKAGAGSKVTWSLTGMKGTNPKTGEQYVGGMNSQHTTVVNEDGSSDHHEVYHIRLKGKKGAPDLSHFYNAIYFVDINGVYTFKFRQHKG